MRSPTSQSSALGALAVEPLYLLVDPAIVGHLATPQLAALAIAATVLTTRVSVSVLLTYATSQVARPHGAGEHVRAGELAAPAWTSASAARRQGRFSRGAPSSSALARSPAPPWLVPPLAQTVLRR